MCSYGKLPCWTLQYPNVFLWPVQSCCVYFLAGNRVVGMGFLIFPHGTWLDSNTIPALCRVPPVDVWNRLVCVLHSSNFPWILFGEGGWWCQPVLVRLVALGKTTVVSFLCRENLSGDMLGGSLGSHSPMPPKSAGAEPRWRCEQKMLISCALIDELPLFGMDSPLSTVKVPQGLSWGSWIPLWSPLGQLWRYFSF